MRRELTERVKWHYGPSAIDSAGKSVTNGSIIWLQADIQTPLGMEIGKSRLAQGVRSPGW
jgi:hypothetical protein